MQGLRPGSQQQLQRPWFKAVSDPPQQRAKIPLKPPNDFAVIRQSVSTLRREHESKVNQGAALKQKLEQTTQDVIDLKELATVRQAHVATLKTTVELKRAKLIAVQQGLRELEVKQGVLRDVVASTNERLEKLAASCAVVRKAVEQNEADSNHVIAKLSQQDGARLEAARARLKHATDRLAQINESIRVGKSKIAELVSEQKTLQTQYDGIGRALEKILQKRREAAESLQTINKQCEDLEANISRIQAETKEVDQRSDRLARQIQEYNHHNEEMAKLNAVAAELKLKLTNSEQRVKDLDSSNQKLEDSLTQLMRRIQELDARKLAAEKIFNQKAARIAKDQETIVALEAELQALVEGNKATKAELATLENQASLLVKCKALEAEFGNQAANFAALDREIEELSIVKEYTRHKASWAAGQRDRQAKLKKRCEEVVAEIAELNQTSPWDEAAAAKAAAIRKQERDQLNGERGELAARRRNLEQQLAQLEITKRLQAQTIEEKEAQLVSQTKLLEDTEQQLQSAIKLTEAEFQQLQLAHNNKIASIRENAGGAEFTRHLDERKEKQAQDLAKLEAQVAEAVETQASLRAELERVRAAATKAREEKARDPAPPRTPSSVGTGPEELQVAIHPDDLGSRAESPRRSPRRQPETAESMKLTPPSPVRPLLPLPTLPHAEPMEAETTMASEVKTNKKGRRGSKVRSPKVSKSAQPPLHPQQPQAMALSTPKARARGRKRPQPTPPPVEPTRTTNADAVSPETPPSVTSLPLPAQRPSSASSTSRTPRSPIPVQDRPMQPVDTNATTPQRRSSRTINVALQKSMAAPELPDDNTRRELASSDPTLPNAAMELASAAIKEVILEDDDALMTQLDPLPLPVPKQRPPPVVPLLRELSPPNKPRELASNERKQGATPKPKKPDKPAYTQHQHQHHQQHRHKQQQPQRQKLNRPRPFPSPTSKAFSDLDENKSQDFSVFEFDWAGPQADEGREMALENQMTRMSLASPQAPKPQGKPAKKPTPQHRIVSSVKNVQEADLSFLGSKQAKGGRADQGKKKQPTEQMSWFEDPEYDF